MQAGGAAALQALLAGKAEEAKPEFLKDRPKYHYYNQWMRQRLAAAAPLALPEPVILKLLEMDAGELDLLLQYPPAATSQVRLWMCLFSIRTPMRRSSNTAHCHSLGTASVNRLDVRTGLSTGSQSCKWCATPSAVCEFRLRLPGPFNQSDERVHKQIGLRRQNAVSGVFRGSCS